MGRPRRQDQPLPVLLASADPNKGQNAAKKCAACHTFDKGGPNKVGPNLYGVVGRPDGSHEGFNYSAALKAKGGDWTYEEINKFITNPKAYVPGHHDGLRRRPSGQERADILPTCARSPTTPCRCRRLEGRATPYVRLIVRGRGRPIVCDTVRVSRHHVPRSRAVRPALCHWPCPQLPT